MTNLVRVEGVNELAARLRGLSEQKITKATVAALNDAAWAGVTAGRAEMERVFDRPTKWVLGGIRYRKASPDRLYSTIDLDFWGNKQGVSAEKILKAEIEGGDRRLKRHEVALQRAGVLPPGMFIVPGQGADLDPYGNMKGGQIVQIISYFRGFEEQGYRANMTSERKEKLKKGTRSKAGFEYFVVKPGAFRWWSRGEGRSLGKHAMQPGVYKRIYLGATSRIIPMMIFVDNARYRRRFDFRGVVSAAAKAQFDKSLDRYLAKMLMERSQ